MLRIALSAAFVLSAIAQPASADPPPWAPAHGWRAKHRAPGVVVVEQPVFYRLPVGIDRGRCDRAIISNETAAGLIGGALGGLAGSQIGDGNGRVAATIGGVLIGILVGRSVGQSMDVVDQACVAQALERAAAGQPVAWRNPDTGARYHVVPAPAFDQGGQYCREYTATAVVGGIEDRITGIACRLADGTWRKVS